MNLRKIKEALVPVVEKIQPVVRVAERVAQVAVHLKQPTVLGVTSMVATGLASVAEQIGNGKTPGWSIDVMMSRGQLIEALESAGARVTIHKGGGGEWAECHMHSMYFSINDRGTLSTAHAGGPPFMEWLRQAIDKALPTVVDVRRRAGDRGHRDSFESRPVTLSKYDNDQATEILQATKPLLEGGRCILLDGRPGVGKTTLAQIIAREANIGRIVLLEGPIVGSARGEYNTAECAPPSAGDFNESLRLLSPGVIIVDDVDKVHLSLANLEAMRKAAGLVILTANNGTFDEVLDGAMMRAGRVDEVFTIKPKHVSRDAPFDKLTDEQWQEVCEWPIAYLNEVKKRLIARPHDLRLADLKSRLERKTRSGSVLR